jgi:tetratricopeptide (TPR) repeat protein
MRLGANRLKVKVAWSNCALAVLLVALLPPSANAASRMDACEVLHVHGRDAEAAQCYEELRRSKDAALRAEGFWGLREYDAANEAFRQAVAFSGSSSQTRVRWGLLLHQRFNDKDAVDLFHEALQQDPSNAQAYLGLAVVSSSGFDGKAHEYVAKAIELNPNLAQAHTVMASLELDDGEPDLATVEADKALSLDADQIDAMAIHAAIDLLSDKSPDIWLGKMRAVNPEYGDGYALIARELVLNRRYKDGVSFYRKAVEADQQLWTAHSQLGINLMRLGEEEEPRRELELAYNHGQTDPATVNSLRLIDSYKNFVTYRTSVSILRLRKDEADLLRPYLQEQLDKSIAVYSNKYKMTLPAPVQVEVYPDHEDFAVRALGMPGLGALGVTFGEVVAMDSPSGRKPGDFNWGATLWHEMSHVFILTATDHRVPRWFTEGLAVHEEGQVMSEWGNRLTPEVVLAIRDKKLLSVTQIDRGFIYPEYPSQVIVSYYQAGTICDFIQQRWGDGALLGMVHSFAESKTTAQAIQITLRLSPSQFDKEYMSWLNIKVGPVVENYDQWHTQIKDLARMVQENDSADVIKAASEAISLYPEYIGDANAYEPLSRAQLHTGDKAAAVDTLAKYEKQGGEDPGVLKQLASMQESLGDTKGAAVTLDHINFIYPMDEALHRHLGDLWFAQGNHQGAIREYTAVLTMHPLDRASAEFDLARAYFAQGNQPKAEECVLLSLEVAPGFRPAQKLLLEIEKTQTKSVAP